MLYGYMCSRYEAEVVVTQPGRKEIMRTRRLILLLAVIVFTPLGAFCRPDNFDDAVTLAGRVSDAYVNIKKLDKEELRQLVEAICQADEEDRKEVSKNASDRVKEHVNNELSKIERLKDEANAALDKVLADPSLKDKYDKARELKEKVKNTWESIQKMTTSLRGSNHPVVSYMLETGQKAHQDYQTNSSNCQAYEWTTSAGRADCLYAPSGEVCLVIELKPDNSRALSMGRGQARGYADALNNNPQELEKLKNDKSAFKNCKSFVPKVRLYKLCPEIDDNGEFRSVSVSWRED